MKTRPDTTVTASVFLTNSEIGAAIANRGDDEQTNILIEMVRAFDNYPQAEMQALYIGKRLFSQSSRREVEDVIRFLRMVLSSCNAGAKKIESMSALPEGHEV